MVWCIKLLTGNTGRLCCVCAQHTAFVAIWPTRHGSSHVNLKGSNLDRFRTQIDFRTVHVSITQSKWWRSGCSGTSAAADTKAASADTTAACCTTTTAAAALAEFENHCEDKTSLREQARCEAQACLPRAWAFLGGSHCRRKSFLCQPCAYCSKIKTSAGATDCATWCDVDWQWSSFTRSWC